MQKIIYVYRVLYIYNLFLIKFFKLKIFAIYLITYAWDVITHLTIRNVHYVFFTSPFPSVIAVKLLHNLHRFHAFILESLGIEFNIISASLNLDYYKKEIHANKKDFDFRRDKTRWERESFFFSYVCGIGNWICPDYNVSNARSWSHAIANSSPFIPHACRLNTFVFSRAQWTRGWTY